MNLSSILRTAKRALETEKGRETGRKLADGAANAARRVAGDKHGGTIDKAHDVAHKYLDENRGEQDGTAERRPS